MTTSEVACLGKDDATIVVLNQLAGPSGDEFPIFRAQQGFRERFRFVNERNHVHYKAGMIVHPF